MANILQQVTTYNTSNLALLLNSYAFISTCNTKFKDFDKISKNLGDSVDFTLPSRFTTTNSLVVSFQDVEQRVERLTVNKPISSAYNFTAQEFIFNVKDYMKEFGRNAVAEIGNKIEEDVATVAETDTFRHFGDPNSPIATYLELAEAIALHRNFGAAKHDTRGYLSDLTYPAIINSGLNQFTVNRGNKESMSWEIGEFARTKWYQSNLLTVHTSGSQGQASPAAPLTVVSVTKDANDAVIAITFSGASAPSDPNTIKEFDKFTFLDGISGQADVRFRTFIGHSPSQSPVQFKATADAASTAGAEVTVNIFPALKASSGRDQNITREIVAGMEVGVLDSHRCGLITSGDPLFLAMPRLPEEVPFPTSIVTDPDTGCSLRQYYGSLFGQNQRGMVNDQIWGKKLVGEYSLMVALPV